MQTRHFQAALAALALYLALAAGETTCGPEEFTCTDKTCIALSGKCSGSPECADGSDEGAVTCSAPNTTLAVGDAVAARVAFDPDHYDILFLLCDNSSCSRVWLWSAGPDGDLRFVSESGCNLEGWRCAVPHIDVLDPESPARAPAPASRASPWRKTKTAWQEQSTDSFPAGDLVFHVEHRALELALWLQDSPRYVASVPANGTQRMLRVTPYRWRKDMPVTFTSPAVRGQGDPLALGEMVQVRVDVSAGATSLGFLMCRPARAFSRQLDCNDLAVRLDASGAPFKYTARTGCDAARCNRQWSGNLKNQGPTWYPFSVVLVALRTWEGGLAVWVLGNGTKSESEVATVPVGPAQSMLFIATQDQQYGMRSDDVHFEILPDTGFVSKCGAVPPSVDDDGKTLCGARQFRCDDGECVCAEERCDGVPRCRDGSDEALLTCGAPNDTLATGETKVVRVSFDEQSHSMVVFLLCDGAAGLCSKLSVWMSNRQGELRYLSELGCNMLGWECGEEWRDAVPPYVSMLRSAELAFNVQHQASGLAVWLQGARQDRAAVVPANDTQTLLRVSPLRWRKDMAVTFASE